MINKSLNKAKPFVKWVGGKRSIIQELKKNIPNQFLNYYEPFVGGGALFFELCHSFKKSFLSDKNLDLMISYKVIQVKPLSLIKLLKEHNINHNKEYYYKMREKYKGIIKCPIEKASLFIYLLKTCFNGLYRVNSKGEFNTPIGSYKNPLILDEDNILQVHKVLQDVEIKYQGFNKILPRKGDFVYCDPPYYPITETSFVSYLENGFSRKDQEKLKDFLSFLDKQGIFFMLSNSDTNFIKDLYKSFKIKKIKAPRVINCNITERKSINELLITNY